MLYLVAIRDFGATGAAMIWRRDAPGTLVRAGDSSRADLRLAGAGGTSVAELFHDGGSWRLRDAHGKISAVRDGGTIEAGVWTVVTLLGGEVGTTEVEAGADLASFTAEGGVPAFVRDDLPALLGEAPWCGVRVRTGVPVAALVRRDGSGATTLYPLPGIAVLRDGRRIFAPTRVGDGDELRVGSTSGPAIRFSDPLEALDRLLGAFGDAPPVPTPKPRASWRSWVGEAGAVSPLELALWSAGAAVVAGYAALAVARW